MASDILVTIGSVNGLSPLGHQAIAWTNINLLLIVSSGRHFHEILIQIL